VDFHEFLIRYFYIPLAAVAGAISALASSNVRKMTNMELFLTFFAGFSFAVFVTPWIAVSWFGIDVNNVRAIAGLTYVLGAGSNVILPVLIEHMKRIIGQSGKGAE
jgi:hypothetical protein